jgi:hypothetical protein
LRRALAALRRRLAALRKLLAAMRCQRQSARSAEKPAPQHSLYTIRLIASAMFDIEA